MEFCALTFFPRLVREEGTSGRTSVHGSFQKGPSENSHRLFIPLSAHLPVPSFPSHCSAPVSATSISCLGPASSPTPVSPSTPPSYWPGELLTCRLEPSNLAFLLKTLPHGRGDTA